MSIKFLDENIFDVYIKKEFLSNIDFNNKESIEKYLKKLFKRLKNKYYITVEGFYNITIYIDRYYGVIFHLEKEDLEYYNYFKNQVDMRLISVETDFLYHVDDMPYYLLNKVNVIIKDKEMYLKLKQDLTKLEMMRLLENSKILYN